MPLMDQVKSQLARTPLCSFLTMVDNRLAIMARHGGQRIFYDDGIWIHQTTHGYFAYQQPYIRLDMVKPEPGPFEPRIHMTVLPADKDKLTC